jgi:GH24 family phage-related lysozyme (muramidase)
MARIVLPNIVTEKDLIEFDLFTVKDPDATNVLIPLNELEASELSLNFSLRQTPWKGYKNTNPVTKFSQIGYGTTRELDNKLGLTEKQSYSYWIENYKNAERKFKRLFPLDFLTQSQYDGLVSLYFSTGSFDKVGTEDRKFDLVPFIKNKQWEYLATALTMSGSNRMVRQGEAKIIMLGDYGPYKDRSLIKEQGLQALRKNYPDNFTDSISIQQAENVYYAETKRFLPKMTLSRQREVVKVNT